MQKAKLILISLMLTFAVQANDQDIIKHLEMLENLDMLEEDNFNELLEGQTAGSLKVGADEN